ncbi:MAG: DEAD/DEAH box helicase family protein [Veillonellales bacterium]
MSHKDQLSEQVLESTIADFLTDSPLYSVRSSADFSLDELLDVGALIDFVRETQPKEWKKYAREFPQNTELVFAQLTAEMINARGTLEVLRKGFGTHGATFKLVYFKPASGDNADHLEKYEKNRFAVVRQFHYSKKTPDKSLDMVILLNGIPLLTMELKNHFTGQNVRHAITQYIKTRDPREPFLKACLVHFAVDDDAVFMTTGLANGNTKFLPFNRDIKNPVIEGKFASSYLWEEILQADSLLNILQSYLHWVKDEKTGKERLIFPRYHQLDAVRALLADARAHGPGKNYLIQHSAGSGKSNSIAWLAHQLANLFNDQNEPVFDSVIVITDRRILDKQLQDTIEQFQQIKGVVTKIDKNTKQLIKALVRGDKIIISTLQKFGFIEELDSLPGKKFAIIVDEAHSSQTGENVKDLKLALTTEAQLTAVIEQDEENREDSDPVEEELTRIIVARQKLPHLSFFAFTATPKPKTMELFGIPDAGSKTGYRAFHYYTMRQAIAEGFILDVLKNYVTYKTYFELIENEKADDQKEFEKLKAKRLLVGYVDSHEHAIRKKAHIMLNHFMEKTIHKINGTAKAMVVTRSRAHAVLYKLAFDQIIKEEGYPIGCLVAFSGTVEIGGTKYTEESMNGPKAKDISETFKGADYRALIVANKFQTGFDQPLLHTMYVDKKLGGVSTVQTLSRLNRTGPPSKQDTMILDFVNTQEEVQRDFQDYYQATDLDKGTNPTKLYNMKYELEKMGVYTPEDVAQFIELFVGKKLKSEKLQPLFQKIVDERYVRLSREDKGTFRKELSSYVRQYAFVSQIVTFIDVELEKLYLFAKLLLKQLPYEAETLPRVVAEMVDMDKYRVQEEENGSILLSPEDATLENTSNDGHKGRKEDEKELLQIIVTELNEKFQIEFDEGDRVVNAMKDKLIINDSLKASFAADNIEDLKRMKLEECIQEALLENAEEHLGFMAKLETDKAFGKFFFSEMFKWYKSMSAEAGK